ncbi:MAG: hypothetical protein NVS1B12_10330 [Acidimicrobiales bacterium]
MADKAVVVGGSISGLAVGLALARRGVEVEIIERDPEAADVVGDMATILRRGTPQARHSHASLALLRRLLLEHAPDVWDALLAAGARPLPIGGTIGPDGVVSTLSDDPELVGLGCRRPVLEATFRRCALAEPRVTFRSGVEVTGFATADGAPPRVVGVRTADGETIGADLVLDASGRASAQAVWLRDIGARPCAETSSACGIVYFSRYYRVHSWPTLELSRGVARGGFGPSSGCIAFPTDNDSITITLGLPSGDGELRRLGKDRAFTSAARLHAEVAPWLEPGILEPLTEPALMAKIDNRIRRFVIDNEPIALGLLPVGDAVCITDPAFGRGMSLGLAHGVALADAITGIDDRRELALQAEQLVDAQMRPWFDDAVAQDAARTARWAGVPYQPPPSPAGITPADVLAAAPYDPVVWRASMRRFNLLDDPGALFLDEAVMAATRAVMAATPPSPMTGPSRDELLAVAG